jgi:hypothetical protein
VALVGIAVVAVAIFGNADGFHAPRWVVGAVGGAFLFFGGWTAAVNARGYDPERPQETLPSPFVQLIVLVPGLLLFAAPFHWIAFGPGPRQFSMSFSIPFLSMRPGVSEIPGRIAFGLGAVAIDVVLIAAVVRLVGARKSRAG